MAVHSRTGILASLLRPTSLQVWEVEELLAAGAAPDISHDKLGNTPLGRDVRV